MRYVRKGEKGIVILAPMIGRKKSADDELAEGEGSRLYGFRAAHVFDVSQTDGEALPEFATISGDPQDATDRLKQFIAAKSIAPEYDDRVRPAQGLSSAAKSLLFRDPAQRTSCCTGASVAPRPLT
jgi:antirestriction protein ArdC